jgi:hypothetical protein
MELKEENQQRRLTTTLDTIEQNLTEELMPPTTHQDNFYETPKEQQARYVTETQFRPWTPSPLSQDIAFNHEKQKCIDPRPTIQTLITPPLSLPIDRARKLLKENKQRRLEARISCLEEQIKETATTNASRHMEYPTLPTTPPRTPPVQIDKLTHQLDINRTMAATQWAIDAAKPTKEEELPREYQ